jgi:signal transduction histidine kinase
VLEQRSRALEEEVRHRRDLEDSLRDALARLQNSEEALQRSLRFSETFVGVLGHDLRNPLMAITTATSLLERLADERQRKALGRIHTSATRMSRMIDQILDFTRVRLGGGFRLDARQMDLREVVHAVIEELEAVDPGCRILFDGRTDACGRWDRDLLGQLVSNLAGNAVQHRAAGSEVRIRLGAGDSGSVVLHVENEGAVPAEVLPELFEPFRGGLRKSVRSSGLGLGLYISHQIVRAHGGRIAVASSEEKGTRFTVELPRDRRLPDEAPPVPA